jgi:type 1 glutamine amidotransferase
VKVSTAWEWPSPEQWQTAQVIVFYSNNPRWNSARGAELDAFLARGGGLLFIHYAVDGHGEVEALAKRIGYAWRGGFSKFRHGPLDLKCVESPITAGFTSVHFVDESYWNLVGDGEGVNVVASGLEEGKMQPLIWTRMQGKGRVCVNILGHYTWTFDDPLFRILLLGICWAGDQPVDRLSHLALAARVAEP